MINRLDYVLFHWIHNNWANPILDQIMSLITYSGNTPLIWIYLTAVSVIVGTTYFSKNKGLTPEKSRIIYLKKALLFMLYSSMIYGITAGIIVGLKKTTHRPRPYED